MEKRIFASIVLLFYNLMYTRYFLSITYKGTSYHGWQRQKEVKTVQGTIEKALQQIRLPFLITGSGRTDRGVHAQRQIAHIDLPTKTEIPLLRYKLNKLLAPSIYINEIRQVSPSSHARFDALSRTYTYHLTTSFNPFLDETSYYCPYKLDLKAMNQAAIFLIGEYNCKSFCKGHRNVPHHICHIITASWHRKEEQQLFTFLIQANRFLHGMVRAIVSTLIEVGRGSLTLQDFQHIIAAQNRCAVKGSAPPQGLFLTKVTYPSHIYQS